MKNIPLLRLVVLTIALIQTGCSSTPGASSLVAAVVPSAGCWYGEDYQPELGQRASWLMNHKSDGTFTIEFRQVAASGVITTHAEAGQWKYADGKYITITTSVSGKKIEPGYIDEYQIKSLSETEMIYVQIAAKQTFRSTKVGCDFVPPTPLQVAPPAPAY